MVTKPKAPLPERNPITYAVHRREVLWQIMVPFLVALFMILMLVILVILAAVKDVGDISRWADVSLIWIITPSMIISFFGLIFLVGSVYLITKLLAVLPSYARLSQDFLVLVQVRTRQLSDKAVEPFLKIHSLIAQAGVFRRK
jgi:hypothetical protein